MKIFGRAAVFFPVLVAILLLFLLFLTVTPSQAYHLTKLQDRSAELPAELKWVIECVDCNKRIFELTNQSMMLDASGYPHIAYGGDHLYYAWFDGDSWYYETADDAAGVGSSAALAIDGNGTPHIVYHDRVIRALKYTFRDADGWHSQIIDDNPGDTGVFTSIALDQNGLPHVTYYDILSHLLRYAYFDGVDWQTQAIDDSGIYSSLALDSSDTPHVSYHDLDSGVLKYAYLDESGWITETLDSNVDAGSFTAIALDEAGYPHIGYFNEISGTLKYAFQDGNGWTIQDVGDGLNAGYYLAFEISPDGLPWMSYYDSTNGNLKVGYWQASTWVSSTVDTEGNVGGYTSLEFNDVGDAFVTYAELFCEDGTCGVVTLKLAQLSGDDWSIKTVDYSSRTGGFTTLGMDSAGVLHLGYVASQGDDATLRYAIREEDDWLVTNLEGAGELGNSSEPSMALDSQDKPRYSYTISTCDMDSCTAAGLIYAELGPSGLLTQTVDNGIGNGLHSSLALDSQDYPHISYYDGGSLSLKYAFLDSMGWHTETVTATTLTTITANTHLQLDEMGYPHIVYNHAGLRYAYQDQDGWHFALVDDSAEVRSSALALDSGGAAHIAYQENLSNTLKYASLDQGVWITETIPGMQSDGFISLLLDGNDVPYIVYHGLPGADLVLTRLSESGWTHEIVDSTGDVGKFTSFVMAEDGSIYIGYYDATNGDLKLASYIDVNMMFIPCVYK